MMLNTDFRTELIFVSSALRTSQAFECDDSRREGKRERGGEQAGWFIQLMCVICSSNKFDSKSLDLCPFE